MTSGEKDPLLLGFRRISTVRFFFDGAGRRRSFVSILILCGVLGLVLPAASLLEMHLTQGVTWAATGWSLYYGAATIASIYLQARTWKELHNCEKEIDGLLGSPDNKSFFASRLIDSYSSLRRPIFMVGAIASVGAVVIVLSHTSSTPVLRTLGFAAYCQMAVHGAVLLSAGYWLLKIPRVITQLTKLEDLNVNELEPIEHPAIRALSVLFSKAGLRAATGILISGLPVILLVSVLHVEWFTWVAVGIVSIGAFVAVSVFALPQLAIHELAVRTILATKMRISSEVGEGEPLSRLAALHQYQIVSGAKTWAVDMTVMSRYGLALLGPAMPVFFRVYFTTQGQTS